MELSRRGVLVGLGSALAAPAIVHFANIMPVRNRLIMPVYNWRPNWSPLYFSREWERTRLERFTQEINREFVRENLFKPYMGDDLDALIKERMKAL